MFLSKWILSLCLIMAAIGVYKNSIMDSPSLTEPIQAQVENSDGEPLYTPGSIICLEEQKPVVIKATVVTVESTPSYVVSSNGVDYIVPQLQLVDCNAIDFNSYIQEVKHKNST